MLRLYSKRILIILISAIVIAGFFIKADSVKAQLILPETECDHMLSSLYDLYGPAAHITTGMTLENGIRAFSYGAGNNTFVTEEGTKLLFHVDLLFDPDNEEAAVKFLAFGEACQPVNGFGPVYRDWIALDNDLDEGENIFELDRSTWNITLNGITQPTAPAFPVRYIWAEVWDGYENSAFASYSYLVDLQNIQNPTGSTNDGPEEESEDSDPSPVLIIPGIMGTELYEDGELIWPNITKILASPSDNFLSESLALDENGQTVNSIQSTKVMTGLNLELLGVGRKLDYFNSLILELENKGFKENVNYFLFPYDWRLDLEETKEKLNSRIEEIKNETGSDKVNIVAHSMGGLIAKTYINSSGSENISKLIFVGTPHLGSPKSAYGLLVGDIGVPVHLLSYGAIREVSRNSPATYELLPNPFYYKTATGGVFSKPNGDILNYVESTNLLGSMGTNQSLLARADQFFSQDLENLYLPNVQIYNIAGCHQSTQAIYFVNDEGKIYRIRYIDGDGTVPISSAGYALPNSTKYYVKDGDHSQLPSKDGVRDLIIAILKGEEYAADNISSNAGFCPIKGKKLTWHSPVEVHIYDQNNNHAGPIDDGFENNISGVQYDIVDGKKFIFLPTDEGQEYRIEGIGEDSSTFDLLVTNVDNNLESATELFDNVHIVEGSSVSFTVSDSLDRFEIEVDGNIVSGHLFSDENEALTEAMAEQQPSPSVSGGGDGAVPLAPVEENAKILGESIVLIRDGTLVLDSNDGKTVYMIGNGKKHGFTSEEVFLGQGFRFSNVFSADISSYELGELVVDPTQRHPNGSLVFDGQTIWQMREGKRYGFGTMNVFKSNGFSLSAVVLANKNDLLVQIIN